MKSLKKSGKFILRVEPELHQSLARRAQANGLSLNELCVQFLSQGVNGLSDSVINEELLRQIIAVYQPLGLQSVVLFGSSARGTQTESSDVDLLLVMHASTSIKRELYRHWDHEKINLHFVHTVSDLSRPSSLWLEVALDGKILYQDQQKLTSNALKQIRQKILRGDFIRKESHGHPYWVQEQSHS